MKKYHQSVLLKESIGYLNVKKGERFIDATAGGGGHTFEILRLGGKVLAIDRDPKSIEHIKKKVKSQKSKVKSIEELVLVVGNFNQVGEIARKNGFGKVDGILFDLGVSSYQLEEAQRGFSFQKSGPLDMRMDPKLTINAADIVNNFNQRRLNEIFKKFGQEKFSWPIANAIIRARQIKSFETTEELANVAREVYRKFKVQTNIDPATKVFQSLRIVINSELLNLEEALPQTVNLLKNNGRLVIISFHSLEDAIVKRFFKENKKLKVLTKSPIGPENWEILQNPRSRSAKLRAAQKI
ncbi:16S rRNA (cytosine(1402)-N(4))-methyltransferase [Candidatus Curtissbacteria bacterium RIFCSPLOWO2_01_FULL_38_11b]|uniref:Ribosomal RNA small subunit methyltransferase H n=1 Tax=Candidatus Curtissbacteria bacterium RIFCSPLOWO2_01_FULL_38_11b TaxID=1797725 RepID=A0A1F5GZE8_9BACT|nr:MAG: 16S rRNA (cytosine(1402)-N(4))-methyltransferase [Candidatus Curtissbacteria bacterium RIFCSPLOWO2_01_FULL_38_11b]